MKEKELTQKELNAAWLKFAEIIERHGKENGNPEWVS